MATFTNNFNGGKVNNNFANGTQNIHKGRDFLQNNSTGTINVTSALDSFPFRFILGPDYISREDNGRDDPDSEDEGDGPLPPAEFKKELKNFKRLYPKLNEDMYKKMDGQNYLNRWQRVSCVYLSNFEREEIERSAPRRSLSAISPATNYRQRTELSF